jgi:hypothetical protein
LVFFFVFLIQIGTTCRVDNHDRKAHTHTRTHTISAQIINLDFSWLK